MAKISTESGRTLVLVGESGGRALVSASSPLTRLNYFDGKFLRAEDLRVEQEYLRRLVHASNRGGGWGVVQGFDLTVAECDRLRVGEGMAVDVRGRVLLLPRSVEVSVAELLEASRSRRGKTPSSRNGGSFEACELDTADEETDGLPLEGLHLVTIAHAEALCGEEDVYGRLCEQACVTESDRPYRVEGVLLRVRPLVLRTPLPASGAVPLNGRHLRSLVASAYFADEARDPASLISGDGLRSTAWCLGARLRGPEEVPLGVLAREGDTTLFLDAWTARRERMETPSRRYWAGRMAMRPWNVFLAHVLQFQCHLAEALRAAPAGGGPRDPCAPEREALETARRSLEALRERLDREGDAGGATLLLDRSGQPEITRLLQLNEQIAAALRSPRAARSRILLGNGIVELPSAGYLPVDPRGTPVERQVRALVGEGVDLRFCVVRPDFVPHALEEAQHMERISLIEGLDDPSRKPEVDVLVPDGRVVAPAEQVSDVYDVTLGITPPPEAVGDAPSTGDAGVTDPEARLRGAARAESLPGGGAALHFAATPVQLPDPLAAALSDAFGDALEDLFEERTEAGSAMEPADGTTDAGTAADGTTLSGATGGDGTATATSSVVVLRDFRDLRSGAWVSVRLDDDPFALAAGDSVVCTARVALGLSREVEGSRLFGVLEIDLDGRLALSEVVNHSDGTEVRTLRGSFPRLRGVITPSLDGRSGDAEGGTLALDVTARLTRGASEGGTLRLSVSPRDEALEFLVSAAWTARRVTGEVRARVPVEEDDGSGGVTSEPIDQEAVVRGTVVDAANGNPLGGATVELTGTSMATVTAQDGTFLLRGVPFGTQSFSVSLDGFQTMTFPLQIEDGSGWQVTVTLARATTTSPDTRLISLAEVDAEETAEVLEAAHPAHQGAVSALDLVARGLAEPGFRTDGEEALFSGRDVSRTPVIRATREWVLFHRRRRKECPGEPRPPGALTWSYALHHVGQEADPELSGLLDEAEAALEAGSVDEALAFLNEARALYGAAPHSPTSDLDVGALLAQERERVLQSSLEILRLELEDGDPGALTGTRPIRVGSVAFQRSGSTLADDPAGIRARWSAAVPHESLLLGAIASRGPVLGDGPVTAEERVGRLMDALDPVTPRSPDATVEVLPAIPAGLAPDGGDGVILLVTGADAPAAITTHVVVGADRGLRLSEDDLADGLTEAMLEEMGEILGRSDFTQGATAPDPDDAARVRDTWRQAFGDLLPDAAVVLFSEGDTEPREAQARALLEAVGAESAATASGLALDPTISLPADAVTFLSAPTTRRARLLGYRGPADDRSISVDDPSLVVTFLPDGTLEAPLTEAQIEILLGPNLPYGLVQLARPETGADPSAEARLRSIHSELDRRDLLADGAGAELVGLQGFELNFLQLPDGTSVDEIVFLEIGG